jgi:uncharacterized membrane protein
MAQLFARPAASPQGVFLIFTTHTNGAYMKIKFLYFWHEIKYSFWFLPLTIMLGGVLLALAAIITDQSIDYTPTGRLTYIMSGSVDAARSILSTISSAMMTVAGTVFSITLVALTLASTQFGPRLLRNFMKDRLNQVVLGVYTSTFIYCLIVLRTVHSSEARDFIPNVSVLLAIVAAVFNIFLLILFIHHTATAIQADSVIASVSKDLQETLEDMYAADGAIEDDILPVAQADIDRFEQDWDGMDKKVLPAEDSRYVQAIDTRYLVKQAEEHDWMIRVKVKPGDFVISGQPLLIVAGASEPSDALDVLRKSFVYGKKRTDTQDSIFAINQLVEVAARALSPGINDPFTAITSIHHLTSAMCRIAAEEWPKSYLVDSNNKVVLHFRQYQFEDFLIASFNQIRMYGKDNNYVVQSLARAYEKIGNNARSEYRPLIAQQLDLLKETADSSITMVAEKERLKAYFDAAQEAVRG